MKNDKKNLTEEEKKALEQQLANAEFTGKVVKNTAAGVVGGILANSILGVLGIDASTIDIIDIDIFGGD